MCGRGVLFVGGLVRCRHVRHGVASAAAVVGGTARVWETTWDNLFHSIPEGRVLCPVVDSAVFIVVCCNALVERGRPRKQDLANLLTPLISRHPWASHRSPYQQCFLGDVTWLVIHIEVARGQSNVFRFLRASFFVFVNVPFRS